MSISIRNSLILSLAAAIFAGGCGRSDTAATVPTIPCRMLQSADLAFRLGRSIESEVVASCDTGRRYSHVGIIIRSDTSAAVIHVEPSPVGDERVRCDDIADFFRSDRASAGAVMRLNGITGAQRKAVAEYAAALPGSDVRFDHGYSMSDSVLMYCTELAERAFAASGISLSQGRRHKVPLMKEPVIMPADISANDSLTTIWSYDTRK